MISSILEKIGILWDNLSLPTEIVGVFTLFNSFWLCIPYAVRFALIGCFSVACVFAIIKMLF